MDTKKKVQAGVALAVALGIVVLGVLWWRSGRLAHEREGAPLKVAVSIPPLAEFASRVGGASVEVITVVPDGADPHTYEPKPSQLAAIADADLYIAVGAGLEEENTWLGKVVSGFDTVDIVVASEGLELMRGPEGEEYPEEEENGTEEGEESYRRGRSDPHVWVSPRNAMHMTANIADAFITRDPDRREDYLRNKEAYIAELEALDAEIGNAISEAGVTAFVAAHPSWGYFARDYGLTQFVIDADGKEASIERMTAVIEAAKSSEVKVIVAAPEFPRKTAEAVGAEIGAEVFVISPLKADHIENMRTMERAILKGTIAYDGAGE